MHNFIQSLINLNILQFRVFILSSDLQSCDFQFLTRNEKLEDLI